MDKLVPGRLLCCARSCRVAQIADGERADAPAANAEAQEAAAADESNEGKNQSILQIKLRKVVVLIGKLGLYALSKTGRFLPRDAMHKRGLCRLAVAGRLSRSCIVLKRLKIRP